MNKIMRLRWDGAAVDEECFEKFLDALLGVEAHGIIVGAVRNGRFAFGGVEIRLGLVSPFFKASNKTAWIPAFAGMTEAENRFC